MPSDKSESVEYRDSSDSSDSSFSNDSESRIINEKIREILSEPTIFREIPVEFTEREIPTEYTEYRLSSLSTSSEPSGEGEEVLLPKSYIIEPSKEGEKRMHIIEPSKAGEPRRYVIEVSSDEETGLPMSRRYGMENPEEEAEFRETFSDIDTIFREIPMSAEEEAAYKELYLEENQEYIKNIPSKKIYIDTESSQVKQKIKLKTELNTFKKKYLMKNVFDYTDYSSKVYKKEQFIFNWYKKK